MDALFRIMKSLSDTVVLSRNRLSMYFLLYSFQIGLFLWQNIENRDINMLHLVSPFWSKWNLSPFSSKVLILFCVWPLSVIIIQMSTLYKIKNVTSVSSTLSPVSFFFKMISLQKATHLFLTVWMQTWCVYPLYFLYLFF